MKENKLHFPGLNGIRAIAAVVVMIFHTDQYSKYAGIKSIGIWETRMQSYAVVLFFVLSGFLITFLLLKEKEKYNTINLKNFYIRRILRIWPVYYATLTVGLILLVNFAFIERGPINNLVITSVFYAFLIPNIGFLLGYAPDIIGILWSVGVEEQFYAFWPFLVGKSRNVLNALLVFLILFLSAKYISSRFDMDFINNLLGFLPFDCMAIGGISACLVFNKNPLLKIIYHPIIQLIAWGWLAISIFYKPVHIPILSLYNRDYHAVIYAIIILNVSTNPKTLISLENKLMNFLGKISYGIYAYHVIVLFAISSLLKPIMVGFDNVLSHLVYFACEIGTTITVANLSFKYFESWFLMKKEKFIVIKSSANKVKIVHVEKAFATDNDVLNL